MDQRTGSHEAVRAHGIVHQDHEEQAGRRQAKDHVGRIDGGVCVKDGEQPREVVDEQYQREDDDDDEQYAKKPSDCAF